MTTPKTPKPFMHKRRENPSSHVHDTPHPDAHRRKIPPNSLMAFVWNTIVAHLANKAHGDYIPEWEDQMLFLYYRLMDSVPLKTLHSQGELGRAYYLILNGVTNAKRNAYRSRHGKPKSKTSNAPVTHGAQTDLDEHSSKKPASFEHLSEKGSLALFQSMIQSGKAHNDLDLADLDSIDDLAENDDDMRYRLDLNERVTEMLLEESPRDRKIFLAKVFTKNTSKVIADWLNTTDTIVNNQYHRLKTKLRAS